MLVETGFFLLQRYQSERFHLDYKKKKEKERKEYIPRPIDSSVP